MTQEEAKVLWPIIKAWSEGKTIQTSDESMTQWIDALHDNNLWLTLDKNRYRIKPEPKLRPWKPEEVPVGALIRWKDSCNASTTARVIQYVGDVPEKHGQTYICFLSSQGRITGHGFNNTLKDCEHSLDHGKTWLPCGVMEDV